MKVPVYTAAINDIHYSPIVGWNYPVVYTRPQPPDTDGMKGHYAPELVINKDMRPLMAPFTKPGLTSITPDGVVDSGAFASQSLYSDPTSFGMAGLWNMSRLMQVQMPQWAEHYAQVVNYQNTIDDRTIEDAWITHRPCVYPSDYTYELSVVSWNRVRNKSGFYNYYKEHKVTTLNKPNPDLSANPCQQAAQWGTKRASHRIVEDIQNVLAYYDPDEPVVEVAPHEFMPTGFYRTFIISGPPGVGGPVDSLGVIDKSGFPLVNGKNLWDVQPCFYEPDVAMPYTWLLNGTTYSTRKTVMSEAEIAALADAYWATLSSPGPMDYELFVSGYSWGEAWAGSRGIAYYVDSEFGTLFGGNEPYDSQAVLSGNSLGDYVENYEFGNTPSLRREAVGPFNKVRPIAWKHDDPMFAGYVPYHPFLFDGTADVAMLEEYANEPDDRFDGLYFDWWVKVSNVTRAWTAIVQHVTVSVEPDFLPLKEGKLMHTHWRDTVTGEITYDGQNYCEGIAPIATSSWMSPDVIGIPEYPGFDWGGYDWPSLTIDLAPGTFLLEDGSAAPIYPTFYGAYVYDMQLKKWGRYDGEYKRLLDYAAINTYIPNTSSYKRVGIYGGSLDADGKIRLFDENPATSWVKFGKIGYYRQGMTSVEEVRAHFRVGATGTLSVESSVEGKLIDPTLNVFTEFENSMKWVHYGSYSAKWHNILISGKFDLSYLEFRGIISGRR